MSPLAKMSLVTGEVGMCYLSQADNAKLFDPLTRNRATPHVYIRTEIYVMAGSFRCRMARFKWSDYTGVCISSPPSIRKKVTAAVKIEGRTWELRHPSQTSPKIYVRKSVYINGNTASGRDVPREYEIWSNLGNHAHILACEDFQCFANAPALDEATFWSEYCVLGDLGPFARPHASRLLSTCQARQVAYQISSALAFIHYSLLVTLDDSYGAVEEAELLNHATLLHRDIKPQNKGGDDTAGRIHVKLGDFGCAKQLEDDTTLSDAGTIHYRAPETRYLSRYGQFQRPSFSVKSDIWSFGGWFRCVSLDRDTLTDTATIRDLTDSMASLCADCLHEDPTKRPSSVQVLENLSAKPVLKSRIQHESLVV
ncbi:kinase-like protein [Pyrenochaeta sp. DS3sAY3a]|nr:kinase-like protein [Pyrenochaeta sp. DS3sAY3a]